jgi:hypothetical protein
MPDGSATHAGRQSRTQRTQTPHLSDVYSPNCLFLLVFSKNKHSKDIKGIEDLAFFGRFLSRYPRCPASAALVPAELGFVCSRRKMT